MHCHHPEFLGTRKPSSGPILMLSLQPHSLRVLNTPKGSARRCLQPHRSRHQHWEGELAPTAPPYPALPGWSAHPPRRPPAPSRAWDAPPSCSPASSHRAVACTSRVAAGAWKLGSPGSPASPGRGPRPPRRHRAGRKPRLFTITWRPRRNPNR